MRIQLWSYNYDPEPSGIAPLSGVWARAMRERGHDVVVVSAHPHYPKPVWGQRLRPYRERRGGVSVFRLPLWIGRDSGYQRVRQEVSYMLTLSASVPFLPSPDVIVAVTPSFPGLLPAMLNARARRIPWVMWLQDILPDGAATTGLVESGLVLRLARSFERLAYQDAAKIAVISDAFERNLRSKGVPPDKMVRIYNPSVITDQLTPAQRSVSKPFRLLVMGNIGHSQGLSSVVAAIQDSGVLEHHDACLRIAGHGVAAEDVRAHIRSNRVEMLGLLFGADMQHELSTATIGLVTQRADVTEFNLPSKLMNYMAHGVPVLAIVNSESETARLVRESHAGWIVDSASPADVLPRMIGEILADPEDILRRGQNALEAATREFAPAQIAEQYEMVLADLLGSRVGMPSRSLDVVPDHVVHPGPLGG